jgi:hypothetical protein
VLQVVRTPANADQQERSGDAVDEEPKQGEEAQESPAALDQHAQADALWPGLSA